MYSEIIQGVRERKRRFIARAITHVENNSKFSSKLLSELYSETGSAYRIGVTGPPGAGKSSLTDKLIQNFREQGKTVAVIVIDPTSPFSGGAILGDRIRMIRHYNDNDVYIRSMASRGGHGGLAQATQEVGDVLDAAGFDIILFETVGVGQVELDVIQASDTVVVVLVPESGDDIQMMKAGLMEIADIFAINKSDRPGSNKLYISIMNMLSGIPHDETTWIPKVVKTVALKSDGVSELVENIQLHREHIKRTGLWNQKMVDRYAKQVKDIIFHKQNERFWTEKNSKTLDKELSMTHEERKSPQALAELLYHND
ncbi:MAG: methylmalonyl Co-A mutase-associated GTPase MeaB [Candidatus Marinimicrobia bacterium]|nr:methylmalonyl Co-A mutase-associated GTPase MeaB [Candidatus Neomarinimicrobiota bacterium]